MLFLGQQPTTTLYSSLLLVQEGLSLSVENLFSQEIMLQLDKFTYFTQFFWLCLFFFTFYIFLICMESSSSNKKKNLQKTSSSPFPLQ
jgi:hypothetical protein